MANDSKSTFCTHDGCNRPRRERMLCSTHYNQKHQPNRHRKVTMQCAWCGMGVAKDPDPGAASKHAAVFCSLEHRDNARRGTGEHVELPADHWDRWYGRTSPWSYRAPKPKFQCGSCDDCGALIVEPTGQTASIYCGHRCARRVARRARRAREHNASGSFRYSQVMAQYQRQGYSCAYCKRPALGLPDPEHVLALSRGGRNDMSNLVAACRACNTDKGDLTLTEWATSRAQRGLTTLDTTLTGPAYRHLMHAEPTSKARRLAA